MLLSRPSSIGIEDLVRVARGKKIRLDGSCLRECEEARNQLLKRTGKIYGVTTGFGALAHESIPLEKRKRAQLNLIRSHSSGVGDPLPFLLANEFIKNYSGVRRLLIERLKDLLNRGDYTTCALIRLCRGQRGSSAPGSCSFGSEKAKSAIEPIEIEEKEGLSLINGSQFMTSIAALALHDSYQVLESSP
jgi:histidine ammonia-lyase